MIEHTNELEKKLKEGVRFRDCFKGVDLRRTEIVVGIWLVQTLGGQNLMGYFAYFLSVFSPRLFTHATYVADTHSTVSKPVWTRATPSRSPSASTR